MIFHNSRDARFRFPGGALACGETVRLSVRADSAKAATLRLWKDGREWKIPMAHIRAIDGSLPSGTRYLPEDPRNATCTMFEASRLSSDPQTPSAQIEDLFTCEVAIPEDTGNLWYFFLLEFEDTTVYYGNAQDLLYGEGMCYGHEPPSYQITVYDPKYEIPDWMHQSVMLQIMPDRFYQSGQRNPDALISWAYYHENWYDWPDLNLELDALDHSSNDFFGGNFRGVLEKLPYIESLGITVIYFNPIFRSPSNHKYDTGNFLEVDPSFGTQADFERLCEAADARGIRIILDGVFSHVGADSLYFNKYGNYGENIGAYQDAESPYRPWFRFDHWPDEYESWWGFQTLPNINEMEESYSEFINGENGIIAHWLDVGTGGWRLDVADELPMAFLRELRQRTKQVKPDAAVIGEVWEDPTNKVSYGESRCYCTGDTLDSVMNYPLRDAIFEFLRGKSTAAALARKIEAMEEAMPPQFFYALMNLLGSHDKPRAINVLADCGNMQPERQYRFPIELTPEQYARGKRRLIAAWQLVCALPGMPCLYYGDEAGLTGMADPFCRKAYPWGQEDQALMAAMRAPILERRNSRALQSGKLRVYADGPNVLVIQRFIENNRDAFGKAANDETIIIRIDRTGL